MKRICIYLLVAVMLLGMIPFGAIIHAKADAKNGMQAVAVQGTPTIDGSLSEWADAEKYVMERRAVDGTAATTGWFQVQWDADAIYIGGKITDATKDPNNDILKVLLDFDGRPEANAALNFSERTHAGVFSRMTWGYCGNDNNPKNPNPYNPVNAWGGSLPAGSDVIGDGESVNAFVWQYADGAYEFELSMVPTAEMRAKLQENTVLGFDIQWVDFNGAENFESKKNTTIGWASDEMDWNADLSKIGELKLAGQPQIQEQETDYIKATDERLTYLGRWKERENDTKESFWNAPSVALNFTGSTFAVDLAKKSAICVEMDGVVTTYYQAEGKVEIPVSGAGTHSVKVYGPGMQLKGFYVEKGSAVSKTPEKPHYAMFIGDSISEDLRSGTFNAGRIAGWDWTVYALGGIALSDGNGYYNGKGSAWGYYNDGYYAEDPMNGWDGETRIGMESAFFNYERPIDKAFGFTPYQGFAQERQPDAIFIALGVNDYLQNQAQSDNFVSDYAAFVKKLRGHYPNATIYIVQALNDNGYGLRQASIAKAAKTICAGDSNVVFLSQTPQWGIELSGDNTHPSQAGYEKMTQKLAALLEEYAANGGPATEGEKNGTADYGEPLVDASLTEWGSTEKYPLSQRVVDGEAQTSGWYAMKWNENAIYVAGEITDATEDANNDIIKILLDFDGCPESSETLNFTERTHAGVYSWMTWGYCGNENDPKNPNPHNPVNAWGGSLPAGSDVVGDGKLLNAFTWRYSEGKYIFELCVIPTDEMKQKLLENAELGFDIRWVDHNNAESFESTKNTTIGWASDELDWNADLSKIGKIKLIQTGTGEEQPITGFIAEARNDTPKVDGKLTEWDDEKAYEMAKRVIDGDADTSGWFKMKWDSKAIYVAGRIEDATKDKDNDIVKFVFDFEGVPVGETPVRFYNRNQAGVYSWMTWGYNGYSADTKNPAPWNPLDAWCNNLSGGMDVIGDTVNDHKYVWQYRDGGYDFEIAIYPNEAMKQKLAIGGKMGFDIQWIDHNGAASSADSKKTTIGWASENIDWGDDLRSIGWVKFQDGPRNTPPEDVPYKPAYTKPEAQAGRGSATVDGELKEWAIDTKYELTQKVEGKAINTGWYKVKWDDNAIYIAGQINDATEDANNDLVKVAFDFDGRASSYQLVDFSKRPNAGAHAWMTWGYSGGGGAANPIAWNPQNAFGIQGPAGTVVIGNGTNANSFVWKYKDGAYQFELVLYPTAEMKQKLTVGTQIGFDIQWVDHNNAGSAQDGKVTTIGWASPYADWNTDLCSLGLLTLIEAADVKPLSATENAPAMEESALTSTTITMKWTEAETADNYLVNLFRVTEENGQTHYQFMGAESTPDPKLTVTGLDPNRSYATQVIALDANGGQLAVYKLQKCTTLLYDEGGSDGSVLVHIPDQSTPEKPAEPEKPDIQEEDPQNITWIIVLFAILFVVILGVVTLLIIRKNKKKS